MTEVMDEKKEDLEKLFYLPDLAKLSENEYQEKLEQFYTGIPYRVFHRNVLIALERAEKLDNKD